MVGQAQLYLDRSLRLIRQSPIGLRDVSLGQTVHIHATEPVERGNQKSLCRSKDPPTPPGHPATIFEQLSPRLLSRLEALVSKAMARELFHHKTWTKNTDRVRAKTKALADYLRVSSNQWEVLIGHRVPRNPFVHSAGDASEQGLGFHCIELKIYSIMLLSADTHQRCFLAKGHPKKLHINQLELIAVILQLAAAIMLRRDPAAHHCPEVRERLRNLPPVQSGPRRATTKPPSPGRLNRWPSRSAAKTCCNCTVPCCATPTSSSNRTGYRPPTTTLPTPSRVRPNRPNKRPNHSHYTYNRPSIRLHCISNQVLGCARRSGPRYPAMTEHF
jgi:hypothetical protein